MRSLITRHPKSIWSYNPIPDGCALYLPLWHLSTQRTLTKTPDLIGHLCTTSGVTWGANGGVFDGTDDIITIPAHSSLLLGSGDFTLDFRFYQSSLTDGEYLMGTSSGVIDVYLSGTGGAIKVDLEGASTVTSNASLIVTGSNQHIAIVRSGDDCLFYKNGTLFQTSSNGFASGDNTTSEDLILGYNS